MGILWTGNEDKICNCSICNCTVWVLQALMLLQRAQGSLLHGYPQKPCLWAGTNWCWWASQIPLGDVDCLLTNGNCHETHYGAQLLLDWAQQGSFGSKLMLEQPLTPAIPLLEFPSLGSVTPGSLSADLSSSGSRAAALQPLSGRKKKKNKPKADFVHSLCSCAVSLWLFYKPEPRVRAHEWSRKKCGPSCWDQGVMSQQRKLNAFVCLTLVLLLQLSISRVLGGGLRWIYSAGCCSPLVVILLLLGKHNLKFCMGGEHLLESKINSY